MNKQELLEKREELFKKKKYLDSQLTKNYNQLRKLTEEENDKKIKNWNNDWEWLLEFNEEEIESTVKYNFLKQKLQKLGISFCGYYSDINQNVLQISSYTKNNYNALTFLLPYIKEKEFKDLEKKYKTIDIMDKDLSEYASYSLLVNDNEYLIYQYIFGNGKITEKFDSLKKALIWIEENLFEKE